MSEGGDQRRLSAILAADMVGYTRRMEEDTDGTVAAWKAARSDAIDPTVAAHSGRIVKLTGDGFLAEFSTVLDAVRCAISIQQTLLDGPLAFRMGVNMGDIIDDGEDIHGEGVNIAARIEALAEPGGICISSSVHDQVLNRLDHQFEDMGEIEVKNVARPVRVFRVLAEGEVASTPVLRFALWRNYAAAAVVIVAAIAGAVIWWQQRPDFEPADQTKFAYKLPEKPSIAVLPFDNMSGDPDQEFLADSFSENIIAILSASPELFVIARNSTFVYKSKPTKVQKVAEDLGVRYVIEGSVLRTGEQVRVTAQLIDAIDGKHLWAKRYNRELKGTKELFAIQDDIAIQISQELHVSLTFGEGIRRISKSIGDFDTVVLLGRANEAFQTWSPDGNREAESLYGAALNTYPDSDFVNSNMGWVHLQKMMIGISKDPRTDSAKAREFAEKSLSINENSYAHLVLATIDMFARDHNSAITHTDRAIELLPGGADPVAGWVKLHSGQPKEAAAYTRRVMRLTPFHVDWVPLVLADSLVRLGQYDEAKAIYQGVLASPTKDVTLHPRSLRGLAAVSVFEGDIGRARGFAEKSLAFQPDRSVSEIRRALFYEKDQAFVKRYLDALRQAGLPEDPPSAKPKKPSIAVLPFTNMSGDKDQEYFADGMTDDLITDLSRVSGLMVIARNSTFTYKGKAVKVQQVAKDLNVSHVLEGSVRREGDQIRINAQLIDGKTGKHLWAERYDRDYRDIFALQDEVTAKIVAALKLKLTPAEKTMLARKPTENLEAYESYLRARQSYYQLDTAGLTEALSLYRKAIDNDPTFTDAYAGLAAASAYVWRFQFFWVLRPSKARQRAERSIERALKLDPSNSEALRTRAGIQSFDGNHEQAIATARRALSSASNDASTHRILARILTDAGRVREGLREIETALRLDPKPNTTDAKDTGWVYFHNQDYESASSFYRDAVKGAPNDATAYNLLAASYAQMGKLAEAKAANAQVVQLWPAASLRYLSIWARHMEKGVRDHLLEGLRKSGIPEWPFGFKGDEANRLTGNEIKTLYYGGKRVGKDWAGNAYESETAEDGNLVFRMGSETWSSKAHIEGDLNCYTGELLFGRKNCVPVYRNPGGTRAEQNEYVQPSATSVYYFSVVD